MDYKLPILTVQERTSPQPDSGSFSSYGVAEAIDDGELCQHDPCLKNARWHRKPPEETWHRRREGQAMSQALLAGESFGVVPKLVSEKPGSSKDGSIDSGYTSQHDVVLTLGIPGEAGEELHALKLKGTCTFESQMDLIQNKAKEAMRKNKIDTGNYELYVIEDDKYCVPLNSMLEHKIEKDRKIMIKVLESR